MLERNDLLENSVKINGVFIEDMISGYRTFSVTGRNVVTKVFDTFTVGSAIGDYVNNTNLESKNMKITFVLVGENHSDVLEKLNHLNNVLNGADESDFVFNDESDKYYTGYAHVSDDIEVVDNIARGTWEIFCPFPLKRSVNEIIKSTQDSSGVVISGNTATFTFDYNGTYNGKPKLQAEFVGTQSEIGEVQNDGDCGYVAFMDSDGNMIQLGNTKAIDFDQYAEKATPINRVFENNNGYSPQYGGTITNGVINDPHYNNGKGYSKRYLKVATYPTLSVQNYSSVVLTKSVACGTRWKISLVHRFCGKKGELGSFMVRAMSGNKELCAFMLDKNQLGGLLGEVNYRVNGEEISRNMDVNFGYHNTHFGYCDKVAIYSTEYYNKKTGKYQTKKIAGAKTRKVFDKYKYTKSNLTSVIEKNDDKITFNIGGLKSVTYSDSTIKNETLTGIEIWMGAFPKNRTTNQPTLDTNAIRSIKVENIPNKEFSTIKNVFISGDIVEADTNDASITLLPADGQEGVMAMNYGALGNQWEDFHLEQGENTIVASWSDWVNPNHKPIIRIIYNEVYV